MTAAETVSEYLSANPYPSNVLDAARKLAGVHTATALEMAFRRQEPPCSYTLGEDYLFMLRGVQVVVTREQMAEWVRLYVSAGDGLTLTQTVRKSGAPVTYAQMRRIFTLCDVYKSSMPFAPHELREQEPEALAGQLREEAEARIEASYKEGEAKRWKTKAIKARKDVFDVELLARNILDSGYLPEPPERTKNIPSGSVRIMLATDWHVGYHTDVLRRRVSELAEHPVQIVCFGGDILDGPQGNMRGHQLHDQDLHFEEQVLEAVAMMVYLVRRVGAERVYCVTGNHDRTSADRKDDPRRLALRLAYRIAEMQTPEAEWTLAPQDVCAFDVGQTRVILTHGDKAKPRALVWAHRTPEARHYLILTGHKHHTHITEDADTLHIQGGSLVGRGEAAERLGLWAPPSQVIAEVTALGPGVARLVRCAA